LQVGLYCYPVTQRPRLRAKEYQYLHRSRIPQDTIPTLAQSKQLREMGSLINAHRSKSAPIAQNAQLTALSARAEANAAETEDDRPSPAATLLEPPTALAAPAPPSAAAYHPIPPPYPGPAVAHADVAMRLTRLNLDGGGGLL